MPYDIAPQTLKHLLDSGSTLALLDVREHGEYNTAHIPGSSSLPRRLIEFRLARLVPHRAVQIVVCDDDGRRARLAGATMQRLGYQRVAVLDGGVNRWSALGYPTEWGMNVPSKDFGEMVEVRYHIPTIDAFELARRQQAGDNLVILDTRTPEEYRRATIPGSNSMPGAELPLRITDIAQAHPDATIVVNCAGRTRSIIGARVLQRMGLPNILSLRNGTSGWLLAGLELEYGSDRTALPEPSAEGRAAAEAFARRVAAEDGVRSISVAETRALLERADAEPVYLLDVRTEGEYATGHIPGFWSFPGGQAVQRADDAVAVRNAHVVFCCDDVVRSHVTASWYRQLGFPRVYAVNGGVGAWTAAGHPLASGPDDAEPLGLKDAAADVPTVTPADLATAVQGAQPPTVLYVDTSAGFARGHVPGARWVARGWLELKLADLGPQFTLAQQQPIVVTDEDGSGALLAAATLRELGYRDVAALAGGLAAWRAAGLPVEQGLSGVMSPPDDLVPAGPDRAPADMIHYLRWEEALGQKYAE